MALPSSGSISLSQVNFELGRSTTATLSMNDVQCRSLAGNGTTVASGSSWSLGTILGRQWKRYSLSGTTFFWKTQSNGLSALVYNGAVQVSNINTALTSFTSGGYTYYRGNLMATPSEGSGYDVYTAFYYEISRA